jgi:hypothetical protein
MIGNLLESTGIRTTIIKKTRISPPKTHEAMGDVA